ncbi:pyridoxamine 5'-phosphate oxidase family protein [Mariniluteicoccus endophyticus]
MDAGFGQFTTLGADECRDLLRTHSVARVGWANDSGPNILPVTYRLDGGDLIFRTKPGTQLSRLDGHRVAVQIDGLDDETRTGWSVLARGTASTVTGEHALDAWQGEGPQPWVGDDRSMLVRIRLDEIGGRVVAAAD